MRSAAARTAGRPVQCVDVARERLTSDLKGDGGAADDADRCLRSVGHELTHERPERLVDIVGAEQHRQTLASSEPASRTPWWRNAFGTVAASACGLTAHGSLSVLEGSPTQSGIGRRDLER